MFRSNTVYFTFNIASSLNSNLYANIYYNGNKYPNPYFTNANQRYILCNQYEENGIRLFTKPKLFHGLYIRQTQIIEKLNGI